MASSAVESVMGRRRGHGRVGAGLKPAPVDLEIEPDFDLFVESDVCEQTELSDPTFQAFNVEVRLYMIGLNLA